MMAIEKGCCFLRSDRLRRCCSPPAPARQTSAKINADPDRYRGKEVGIAGRVTDSYGALGVGAYEIDDGTGTDLGGDETRRSVTRLRTSARRVMCATGSISPAEVLERCWKKPIAAQDRIRKESV